MAELSGGIAWRFPNEAAAAAEMSAFGNNSLRKVLNPTNRRRQPRHGLVDGSQQRSTYRLLHLRLCRIGWLEDVQQSPLLTSKWRINMAANATRNGWLFAIGILCLVGAVFPTWDETVDPDTGDRVSVRSLGLWFSPLQQSIHRASIEGSLRWESRIHWLSWSWILVLLGVVCLQSFRDRSRTAAGTSAGQPAARS
jgi:hypothetical protein